MTIDRSKAQSRLDERTMERPRVSKAQVLWRVLLEQGYINAQGKILRNFIKGSPRLSADDRLLKVMGILPRDFQKYRDFFVVIKPQLVGLWQRHYFRHGRANSLFRQVEISEVA